MSTVTVSIIRKGETYSRKCKPLGCISAVAPSDGLLFETDDGDEFFPKQTVKEVVALLDSVTDELDEEEGK